MSVNRSRHIVALVSLLVFLLAGQAGAQGYFWCLGEDGHTALEYAAGNSCSPDARDQQRSGCHGDHIGPLSSQEDHCGPCLDLPATLEVASRGTDAPKKLKVQIGTPPVIQVAPLHTFASVFVSPPCHQPPPHISHSILLQRTVVFLI